MLDWKGLSNTLKQEVVGFLGNDVTISREGEENVQPVPDTDSARNAEILAKTGVFSAVLSKLDESYQPERLSSMANAMYVVSPGDFEPQAGDTITQGDVVREVLGVVHVRPNGVDTVVHQCMVAI